MHHPMQRGAAAPAGSEDMGAGNLSAGKASLSQRVEGLSQASPHMVSNRLYPLVYCTWQILAFVFIVRCLLR